MPFGTLRIAKPISCNLPAVGRRISGFGNKSPVASAAPFPPERKAADIPGDDGHFEKIFDLASLGRIFQNDASPNPVVCNKTKSKKH